jgi:general secretion pathway protein A
VRALLNELDTHEVLAAQIVSTQLDADDLLRSVATAFGVNVRPDGKAHLLATIEAFLLTTFQSGQRALLIVDEAQNLGARSLEELRMLSNFQCGDHALLQSFLIGQPELRMLMRSPLMEQFRQRVIASYHLGPLDMADTRAYVEHRLGFVGWKNDPQFEADAFVEIHRVTGGVPRRINSLCNRALLAAYLGEKHVLGRADIVAAASEMANELGADLAVQPTPAVRREPAVSSPKRESAPTGGGRIGARPLAAITERIEQLERNVDGLLSIVRGIVEPERALPDEETRGPARSSKGR